LIATGEAGAPASPSIITLTTDFGARDPYVGEMKGVILAIAAACRRTVQIVDITHEVARHDVVEGALALEAAAGVFPAATVHVAVVDPGVGTARRALALAARGQVFVAPDNGLVTPCLDAGWQAVALEAAEYRRRTVSRTFHGRDVFAPAAAHVALGLALDRLGPPLADPVRLPWDDAHRRGGALEGAVLHVDRFGNLVTNIDRRAFEAFARAGAVQVAAGGQPVGRIVATYAEIPRGEICALFGSTDHLELAANAVSAAEILGLGRGALVDVRRA
jgi:S-adenosylmethionine hydrolase